MEASSMPQLICHQRESPHYLSNDRLRRLQVSGLFKEIENMLSVPKNWTTDPQLPSQYPCSWTDCAIPAPELNHISSVVQPKPLLLNRLRYPSSRIEPQFFSCPANTLVTEQTALFQLQNWTTFPQLFSQYPCYWAGCAIAAPELNRVSSVVQPVPLLLNWLRYPSSRIEPQFLSCPANTLVTEQTALSQLQNWTRVSKVT